MFLFLISLATFTIIFYNCESPNEPDISVNTKNLDFDAYTGSLSFDVSNNTDREDWICDVRLSASSTWLSLWLTYYPSSTFSTGSTGFTEDPIDPDSSSISLEAGSSMEITAIVDRSNLSPGSHSCTITIFDFGEKVRTIDVRCEVDESAQEILKLASQVCSGSGIKQASEFSGSKHPIVLVNSSDTTKHHIWSYCMPRYFWPEDISELQLVACAEEERKTIIETCYYTFSGSGPGDYRIHRYQYELEITLIKARTGEVISTEIIQGSTPSRCPSSGTIYSINDIYGPRVSFIDIRNWLRGFYED